MKITGPGNCVIYVQRRKGYREIPVPVSDQRSADAFSSAADSVLQALYITYSTAPTCNSQSLTVLSAVTPRDGQQDGDRRPNVKVKRSEGRSTAIVKELKSRPHRPHHHRNHQTERTDRYDVMHLFSHPIVRCTPTSHAQNCSAGHENSKVCSSDDFECGRVAGGSFPLFLKHSRKT